MEWVQIASTFGFPAFMAVLLFVTYKEMVRQVIEVVKANTQALQMQGETFRALCAEVSELQREIQDQRRNHERV